jgi:hypothetical protein
MITVFLAVVLIFGDRFDEELQRYKLQRNQIDTINGVSGNKWGQSQCPDILAMTR